MTCHYQNQPDVRGYRERLHAFYKEKGLFQVGQQRLCDQVQMIQKKGWLSQLQLEEIKRLPESDIVVSVSIEFRNKLKWDAPFHHIAHDYSRADWDGLCDHLRDVPWKDTFKLSASATASEFCEWIQVGMMYISLILSIRLSLIHLHGFQQLVLLP